MTTLETNKGRIMAPVVPMDATELQVCGTELQFIQDTADSYIVSHVNLPNGDYEFIGVVDRGVPDFDVEPYVKSIPYNGSTMYKNYLFTSTDTFTCDVPMRSFLSLLKKNGIDYENRKIVILGVK